MKSKIESVSLDVDIVELLNLYTRAVENGDPEAVTLVNGAVGEAVQIRAAHMQMLVNEAMAISRLK
ncbi:hypothetical protein [Mesorhizobium sp. M0633]|uniref:hypothetical protein n=1 Tax=Mesorhizobium sp. M0633 TaxID=2956977 RepID=UPI00333BFE8D